MATKVWTGGGTTGTPNSGMWSAKGNWSPSGIPHSTDDVIFGGTNAYIVSLSKGESAHTITISDSSVSLDLDGRALTAGTISNGGTINGAGKINGNITGTGTVETQGGTVTITGDITGAGTYIVNGGKMVVDGNVDTTGASSTFELGAGTLKFGDFAVGAVTIKPMVDFEGPTGELDLSSLSEGPGGNLATFGANVLLENMAGSDSIKIKGAKTAFFASGTLFVYDKNHTQLVALHFTGPAPAPDGTQFTVSGNMVAICFMAGTSIATPDGDRAVEALAIGDIVLTADGNAAPVRWIGRQTVSTTFGDPLRVMPVRIKAGALGENQPTRDLLVSPDHALLVDGILVHAGALANGSSIVRETDVPTTFIYYHIELAGHALLLAEGVPAETFIDNVDRMAFDNWAEHEALYPKGGPLAEMGLPRAKSFRQVPASLRKRLADRAVALFGADALAA